MFESSAIFVKNEKKKKRQELETYRYWNNRMVYVAEIDILQVVIRIYVLVLVHDRVYMWNLSRLKMTTSWCTVLCIIHVDIEIEDHATDPSSTF